MGRICGSSAQWALMIVDFSQQSWLFDIATRLPLQSRSTRLRD